MSSIDHIAPWKVSWTGVRVPFLVASVVAFVAFAVDGYEVFQHPPLGTDVALERAVQGAYWGPLTVAFGAIDWFEGLKQVAGAVIGLLLVLAWNRRGFLLMLWGALSASAYTIIELLVQRPRPGADLVHVVRHASGYGFPSGHALFFTWFIALLLLILGRRYLPRPLYLACWVVGGIVLAIVCTGRVYSAEHWPSDVLAGVLLGIGWVALGLSVRKLSDPVLEDSSAR